ncbi:MAG: hypothetical protein JWN17_307, partial [Frankiales bacterium]|nr:hypothetical protein [Frankiales bacterium]
MPTLCDMPRSRTPRWTVEAVAWSAALVLLGGLVSAVSVHTPRPAQAEAADPVVQSAVVPSPVAVAPSPRPSPRPAVRPA